jgi:hypothetical protein
MPATKRRRSPLGELARWRFEHHRKIIPGQYRPDIGVPLLAKVVHRLDITPGAHTACESSPLIKTPSHARLPSARSRRTPLGQQGDCALVTSLSGLAVPWSCCP